MDLLKPGTTFREMTFDSLVYDPNEFHQYSCLYHGVGLADEYPCIHFPWSWMPLGMTGSSIREWCFVWRVSWGERRVVRG